MDAELEQHVGFFTALHQAIAAQIADLPPEALNWRPLEGEGDEATNSIAALITHLTGSERFLIGEVAGGRPVHRDREAEFRARAEGVESLRQRLDEATQFVGAALSELRPESLNDPVSFRDRTVTRRWAVLHALEHVGQHLGHIQLTRQLWKAKSKT
jgi:uncharacterized damage-inducible protein DinB